MAVLFFVMLCQLAHADPSHSCLNIMLCLQSQQMYDFVPDPVISYEIMTVQQDKAKDVKTD